MTVAEFLDRGNVAAHGFLHEFVGNRVDESLARRGVFEGRCLGDSFRVSTLSSVLIAEWRTQNSAGCRELISRTMPLFYLAVLLR